MYYDFTVPIPDVKGKITFMKKGNARYVQLEIGRVYLPEKQYTIPQRVTIGKRDPENPDRMFPNQNHRLSRWYAPRLQGVNTGSVSRRIERFANRSKFSGRR